MLSFYARQIKLLEGSPGHLLAAAEILRASAQLFSDAGSNGQAAETYLQAGDIYSTLRGYHNGRASYSQARRARSGKAMQSIEPHWRAPMENFILMEYRSHLLDETHRPITSHPSSLVRAGPRVHLPKILKRHVVER
jgi:hypothetical protein